MTKEAKNHYSYVYFMIKQGLNITIFIGSDNPIFYVFIVRARPYIIRHTKISDVIKRTNNLT